MTVKEIFKNVEGYNTIARATGRNMIYILFDFNGRDIAYTREYNDFKRTIMHELTPNAVKAIMNDIDSYQFGDEKQIDYVDFFGKVHSFKVTFNLAN